jgi:hypothetical protein
MRLCEAGASTLDPDTGTPLIQCKGEPVSKSDEDDAPDYGQIPYMCALGLFAKPAPKDADGAAQLLVDDSVPGMDGAVVGGYDLRTVGDIIGEIGAGETAVGATGKGFASRVLCKDRMLALMVDDDTMIILDGKKKSIQLVAGGAIVEIGKDGILLRGGGAELDLSKGLAAVVGTVVLGGRTPTLPLCSSPGPVVGVTGATAPTPGVFFGA